MSTPITSCSQFVKVAGLQLTPFFASVALFFYIYLSHEFFNSQLVSTVVKCVPIFCLMAFTSIMGNKFNEAFRKRILYGLIFSCIGDVFLDYNESEGELFPFGMVAFAVAQILYISAFGWKPLRPMIGIFLFALGVFALSFMYENFDAFMVVGVPFYTTLLATMVWRVNARVQGKCNIPKILAAIGGTSFLISDTVIAFDKFYSPINNAKIIFMITYYTAQFGITMSMLDHEVAINEPKKKSK